MPRAHACVLVAMLVSAVTTSGCATLTKLGYVPELLKPSDTTTYIPNYIEVKRWAYDVADGYDSRAIINRRAGYAAAILAAAATGAIAGLGAFDPGSSAIIGIPIGTTFLAGVAYLFSNEEKAHIYDLGSRYIKDLITLSDERLAKRRIAAQRTTAVLNEAQDALTKAEEQLGEAKGHEKAQKDIAEKVHRKLKEAQDALTKAEEQLGEAKRDEKAQKTLQKPNTWRSPYPISLRLLTGWCWRRRRPLRRPNSLETPLRTVLMKLSDVMRHGMRS